LDVRDGSPLRKWLRHAPEQMEAAMARSGLQGKLPHIAAFVKRVQQRPAYKRALERGGPYTLG